MEGMVSAVLLFALVESAPIPSARPAEWPPEEAYASEVIPEEATPKPRQRPSEDERRVLEAAPEAEDLYDPTVEPAPEDPDPATTAQVQIVCRDPRLVGRVLPRIVDPNQPCGIANPVEITLIDGAELSTPAKLTCPTARRVADWVSGIARPAARRELSGEIAGIWVMGSYACRTRNHRAGAKISEHARGRAIDIGGVVLGDGRDVTVLDGWDNDESRRFYREVHKKACGLFSTVLGPEADKWHKDHLHFDMATRLGDPYCR